jgi:hypothetical protein
MPGAALDAHCTAFAIGKGNLNGDAVVSDDHAMPIGRICCTVHARRHCRLTTTPKTEEAGKIPTSSATK